MQPLWRLHGRQAMYGVTGPKEAVSGRGHDGRRQRRHLLPQGFLPGLLFKLSLSKKAIESPNRLRSPRVALHSERGIGSVVSGASISPDL
jgi:hypothetical protein